VATRLQTIPGVGVLTATALVGAVNHLHAFRRGRDFASWLGLTPREWSTGGRRYLGRISKRGDVHLRCLLAHGARAVLRTALRRAPDQLTRLQEWAVTTAARRGRNKATIAWRISWRGLCGPSGERTTYFMRGPGSPRPHRSFHTRRGAQRGRHAWHDRSDRRRVKPQTPLTLEVAFH
jgi:hypothetical protein